MCLSVAGCGNPGTPQPPSLKIPNAVSDLTAVRTGDTVQLHWTMTRRSTDKLLLRGDQRAAVCRSVGDGACQPVCTLLLLPNAPAACEDRLPVDLQTGATRLLRYQVRLRNHNGKDAGPSNEAYAAAGFAPPAMTEVAAQVTPKGIRLQWKAPAAEQGEPAPGAHLLVRIDRDRVLQQGESASPTKVEVQDGAPQPLQQVLEAAEQPPAMAGGAWVPDHTLDAQARLNRSYRYTLSLVEECTLEGHPVRITGISATSGVVSARDVFPPAEPQGLAAVASPEGKAIDLSWNADAETDLAGYVVYRRSAASQTWTRISGDKPIAAPAWSDTRALAGVRYSYAVAAVDESGNESERSTATEEELPEPNP